MASPAETCLAPLRRSRRWRPKRRCCWWWWKTMMRCVLLVWWWLVRLFRCCFQVPIFVSPLLRSLGPLFEREREKGEEEGQKGLCFTAQIPHNTSHNTFIHSSLPNASSSLSLSFSLLRPLLPVPVYVPLSLPQLIELIEKIRK